MANSVTANETASINVEISLKEFKFLKSSTYCQTHPYLFVLNDNIRLNNICDEYTSFCNLIHSVPELSVFLKPVFQHLHDLLLYSKGFDDACLFLAAFKELLPKDFYDQLQKKDEKLRKEEKHEKEDEHLSVNRMKVELSKSAYLHLRNWLEETIWSHLPNPSTLRHMNILQVLNEHFHLVIHDENIDKICETLDLMKLVGNQEEQTGNDRIFYREEKIRKEMLVAEVPENADSPEESHFRSRKPCTTCRLFNIKGKDPLSASDIHPQIQYVACGHESSNIRIWRPDTSNEPEFKLSCTLRGHRGIVHSVAADSKLPKLISGCRDLSVRCWDLNRNTCLSSFQKHTAAIIDVCTSPNSKYFISVAEDSTAILYSYIDKDPLRVFTTHHICEPGYIINCVRFHPNCYYFGTGSFNGTVMLWALDYTCPVRMFVGHKASVNSISFSPCGKYLASADDNGEVIVWDINLQKPTKRFSTKKPGIRSISYDKTGDLIAAAFYGQSWRVYDSTSTDEKGSLWKGKSNSILKSVHFTDHNDLFMIGWQGFEKVKKLNRPKFKLSV